MRSKAVFTLKEITAIGMMAAMLEAVKVALQGIPNIELVSFLIIMFTLFIGYKSIFAIWVFVGIEILTKGFGLWNLMYLYVWPLLMLLTLLLRPIKSKWTYSILSAVYGLLFGALCAIPYIFMGGISGAVAWWISGIPYDVIHCIGNFVICLILFDPVDKLLCRLKNSFPAQ